MVWPGGAGLEGGFGVGHSCKYMEDHRRHLCNRDPERRGTRTLETLALRPHGNQSLGRSVRIAPTAPALGRGLIALRMGIAGLAGLGHSPFGFGFGFGFA